MYCFFGIELINSVAAILFMGCMYYEVQNSYSCRGTVE